MSPNVLCILLTELDTKGENEKARKQEQRENKAKWQRDDTVSLEHRNTHGAHDSLPEYSSVHTNINSQIKLSTYCLLEASAFIAAGSQRSQFPYSGRREEWSGTVNLFLMGKIQKPHRVFRKPTWTKALVLHLVFPLLMFIIWPFLCQAQSLRHTTRDRSWLKCPLLKETSSTW